MSRHSIAVFGSLLVAALSLVLLPLSLLIAAGPREQEWKQVEQAMAEGKPESALRLLEPIITQAINEKRYPEAIKAVATRARLESLIQGNKPEERIKRLAAEIDKAVPEMKPALEAILANWYWEYFQKNRWWFAQRTQTSAAPEDDFTTWDLPRILNEVDRHFVASLANAEQLKQIPVAQFDDLLEKGNAPDSYRPTLFDILAQNALVFYMSGEQAAAQAYDAFQLSADSPIFGSTSDFINWQPETADESSLTLKAIRLFQQLLTFHQTDTDPSALIDVDLERLIFGMNQAVGDEKDSRYQAALRRFADSHADHPISARALHQLARSVYEQDDWVKAHEIASEGLRRHEESVGGRRCFNLLQEIESKSLQVSTERVWNDPSPTIEVTYRNITKVHFRLVRADFEEFIRSNRWQIIQLDPEARKRLLSIRPDRSWSVDLEETKDFKQRTASFPCPDDLVPGPYYLIASHNPDFGEADNIVSLTEVWRSDLAIIMRNHQGKGLVDGFVLDAKSGGPIAGATVRVWTRGTRNQLTELRQRTTDKDGRFAVRGDNRQQILVLAQHAGHAISSANPAQPYQARAERATQQSLFFTDRAIYRPGQSIHFKGLCVSVHAARDNYTAIANQKVVVALLDVNRKEIERLELRTNDYGSFSGTVTAPRNRLMGQMQLSVIEGPRGTTRVSVEEYKRPKFQVEIDAPAQPAKLNETVAVDGKATAYTGAPINGAKVQWRVIREVRYPDWWFWRCWWLPPNPGDSQEIAEGTSLTDQAGRFTIRFDAKPDPSAPPESEPIFRFSIMADVTDTAGETRSSSRVVQLGYTALSASLSADDWLTSDAPVEVRVRTESFDGEPRPAKGRLQIFPVQQPDSVSRPPLEKPFRPIFATQPPLPDPSNPNSWPLGELAHETEFETDASGTTSIAANLAVGMYRVKLVSTDAFGKEITAELPITVIDPRAERFAVKIPEWFTSREQTLEPGQDFQAVWGSGYESARVFVEVEHRGKLLQQYWSKPGVTQIAIRQPVTEAMRGGFHVRTTMVRENRAYTQSQYVEVPWSNKQLKIRWEHFVSKLEPGSKEVWTAIISGPDVEATVAEMVATLYDASLDAFQPFSWPSLTQLFRRDNSRVQVTFENQLKQLLGLVYSWTTDRRDESLTYRHLPFSQASGGFTDAWYARGLGDTDDGMMMEMADFSMDGAIRGGAMGGMGGGMDGAMDGAMGDPLTLDSRMGAITPEMRLAAARLGASASGKATPDLSKISARKNLNETAFFFPHLVSSKDGTVRLQFTMPEALTEWKFLGFAHDRQLRSGLLSDTTVTAKDLMVQPNPPRFLREGDSIEFTVKVSNQSPTRQRGTVRLTFQDARTGNEVDALLGNERSEQTFEIAAGESTSFSWPLSVPDGLGFLTYKAVGSTGRLADGEEGMLPVLSRRMLVTESLPLPIRGKQTKAFRFEKLIASEGSDSLQHQSLNVQMVSNPAWYAVMSLPYLIEYPYECSEQVFNRLYANALARHLAQSDPKIERIFSQWRATEALDSPLEKNEDLKGVLLEETPWVRQAASESQARRNVGILFDNNRLDQEAARTLNQLSQMQLNNGAWPWFPGGTANDYITLYITTGFGRLRHLDADIDLAPAIKSLSRLDGWMHRQYQDAQAKEPDKNHLHSTLALYLYGRSFFLRDQPIAPEHQQAWAYWIDQARNHWLSIGSRQSQAHLAIALKRNGDDEAAKRITDSLKERSVRDEEMGMYWRDLELSWWWYRAPIETQAMMIEAFDEVADDQQAVEDCKVWLLKQKQTQDWKTTKGTADAVYAMLLRGSNLLASDALVDVKLGGTLVPTDSVEAGTGFFEHRWNADEIKPSLGEIQLTKSDEGVAWGSVHWQYLEDIAKITPHAETPLTLTKQLFVKKYGAEGPTLHAVDGPVEVGDELVVRLVLRTDRDMEYVHMKDYRGSGTEPVNVLSRYQYRDGLAYYESTRDAASHFFIDYLPKGTYVFEYSTRVQLRGTYQTGYANIECMYAPEFNAHSESLEIAVE